MTTTELAIHAYALHRGPIWRSDAWAAPDHHLHIEAPAMTGIDYRIGDTRDVTATIPTGTTLAVANLHGRNAIGIDVDARNRDLLAPRTAEVKRNLFGTKPEMPGQIDLFGAAS